MSEEREFEPTQSRIERAKREGDIARSQELGNVAAFACALLAAAGIAGPIGAAARAAIGASATGTPSIAALVALALMMLLPLTAAAVAAIGANAVQSGGLRFAPVTVKPERMVPAENLKRIFSREAVVTATRATVAFLCACAAIVPAFLGIYAAALHAGDLGGVALAAWSGAVHTALVACAVGGIFAAADYGVQFGRWRKRLRMSPEELKRDQKESDGDPHARSRRRALHRQFARGSLRRIKEAAFVVTNPTHIAIALEYRPPAIPVPRVLVRAADEAAARVRELAAMYDIPTIENVPLARSLYALVQPGEFIPQETYVAVAEIVMALRIAAPTGRDHVSTQI